MKKISPYVVVSHVLLILGLISFLLLPLCVYNHSGNYGTTVKFPDILSLYKLECPKYAVALMIETSSIPILYGIAILPNIQKDKSNMAADRVLTVLIVIFLIAFRYSYSAIYYEHRHYFTYTVGWWMSIFMAILASVVTYYPLVMNRIDSMSNVDKLKKYKELLDSGAITQSEYDEKKEELL